MRMYIEERAMEIASYIVENNVTVRQAAKHFGVSKSTVHKDVTERLEELDSSLAEKVRKILDIHKDERHIKGGYSTRLKYEKLREQTKHNM
ncbi:MAG: sporulation transcriptional regulator SpoIIID [Lachnospiraceae bacterium]|nr:sporulation transcriptional regulator SpoIIID [Lachnospiraceae bacterium]